MPKATWKNVKKLDPTVAVSIRKLHEIRRLAVATTQSVHSSGYLPREDKIAVLSKLKRIRILLDEEIQLTLFSPSQRAR